MTGHDLRELQELLMRAYVRHLMFLVTLPYYLLREMGRAPATDDRRTSAAAPILLSDWRARPKASNE
jgi:hypothetical protein